MSSTLRPYRCLGALGLCLFLAGGCARMNQMHQNAANFQDRVHERFAAEVRPSHARFDAILPDPPMDAATTVRGWDRSTLNYPNGGVIAGPTYNLNYEDRPRWLQNDELYAMLQPGILAVDILLMPFYMVVEPPLAKARYRGLHYPPSMTVAPPAPRG